MKTEYPGIDYSHGKANFDPVTGIHFGVIPLHALSDFAHESFEAEYGAPYCPECGNTVLDDDDRCDKDYYCPKCAASFYSDHCTPDNPLGFVLEDKDYTATHGEDCDIFITRSPYYTHAQFCSPCAPGAGYLLNPCENGPKVYCFDLDWFDADHKCPYPIYQVSDGKLIYTPGE